jgi:hypothetical protein
MTTATDVYAAIMDYIASNPGITPVQIAHYCHIGGYGLDIVVHVLHKLTGTTLSADTVAELIIHEYRRPLVGRDELKTAMTKTDEYSESEAETAITAHYPGDTARYAITFDGSGKSKPTAQKIAAYDVGKGDFSAECYVRTAKGGTVLSRKSYDGGWGNGGFLLVIKPDGVIKLATDDGLGFWEINTAPTAVLDGAWHHISGNRAGGDLHIYLDFAEVAASSRTDRFTDLDINTAHPFMLGATEQTQEPFDYYTGDIGEARFWNKDKTFTSAEDWDATDWIAGGLAAMWNFAGQSGVDQSEFENNMSGDMTFIAADYGQK